MASGPPSAGLDRFETVASAQHEDVGGCASELRLMLAEACIVLTRVSIMTL